MSKEEIKSEINKVLDHFSDKGLEEILNLLKQLDSKLPSVESDIIQKIISEDNQLLQKLAQ